jgi:hypothetical protein
MPSKFITNQYLFKFKLLERLQRGANALIFGMKLHGLEIAKLHFHKLLRN